MNINAGILRRIARLAYDRTEGHPDRAQQIDMDVTVSIVFSAAALEAFINELAALASRCPASEPDRVKMFGSLANQAEEARASIRLKYDLAHTLFTGVGYDKGSESYQNFDLLFKLRDTIVHLKTDEPDFDINGAILSPGHSRLLDRFRSLNILAEIDLSAFVGAAPSLFQWFSSRAVARWACNTASGMVFSILDAIPEGHVKCDAESFYRDNFRRVT